MIPPPRNQTPSPRKDPLRWGSTCLEQGVLEDTLNTTQCGDNVHTVVVQLPQPAVVTPPEGVVLELSSPTVHASRGRMRACDGPSGRACQYAGYHGPSCLEDPRVNRRFWAFAFLRFIEYSDYTRAESMNSASHGCKYRYSLGTSWSSSCDIPAWK